MATVSPIEAHRLNAQKSTGPRPAEGKAASRFDALKYAAEAEAIVVRGENPADLVNIARQYYEELRPEGIVEVELVETLIRCHWQKRRLARLEAAVVEAYAVSLDTPNYALGATVLADGLGAKILPNLFRQSQAVNRDWTRAEKELRRRQSDRLPRPAGPEPPATTPDPATAPPPLRNEPNPEPEATAPPAPSQNPNPQPLTPNPRLPTPAPDPPPIQPPRHE